MRNALFAVILLSGCSEVGSPIPGLLFDQVAVGGGHSCAITSTSDLYCWGNGEEGRLGTGDPGTTFRPVPVDTAIAFASVTAGREHTCGLDRSGEAYCWGFNSWGQLGVSNSISQDRPTPIPDDRVWAQLSAGWYHTCGITAPPEGELHCWGYNNAGQLGHGTLNKVSWPRRVPGALQYTAATVSAGAFHTCAVDVEGQAWCWGRNDQGQLGDGTTERRLGPVPVAGSRRYVEISAGEAHTCGRTADGTVLCWGANGSGEIGHAAFSRPGVVGSAVPGPVAREETYVDIATGSAVSCAVAETGVAFCWGDAAWGQIGRASSGDWSRPADIPGLRFRHVALGAGRHACGLAEGGATVYCWGTGSEGELGNPGETYSPVPIPVIFSD